jgi:hypothetical protein
MYRGIFQHARYLTDFLRDYAVAHDLHQPGGMGEFGRIYRIVREDRPIDYATPRLSELGPVELAGHLANPNGALRDAAQQLLVQRAPRRTVATLERFVRDESAEFYTRLQALWTLEGYPPDRYRRSRLTGIALEALDDEHPRVRAAAIRILEPEIEHGADEVMGRLVRMVDEETAPYTRLQLLASLGEATDGSTLRWIARLLHENAESPYFREMALTGVGNREQAMADLLRDEYGWRPGADENRDWVLGRLTMAIAHRTGRELRLPAEELRLYARGGERYVACGVCHGEQGQGIAGMAPPLAGSEWVRGEPAAVVRIVLHGFRSRTPTESEDVAAIM